MSGSLKSPMIGKKDSHGFGSTVSSSLFYPDNTAVPYDDLS